MARRGFGAIKRYDSKRNGTTYQAFYDDPRGRITLSRNGKPTPVRHYAPLRFTTDDDAAAWLRSERRLISAGEWTPPKERAAEERKLRLTFDEYATKWLDERRVKGQKLSPYTRSKYESYLRRHVSDSLGRIALEDLTEDNVTAWFARMDPDKPTERARTYGVLHAILATATEEGRIPSGRNPARVRGATSTTRRHKIQTATVAQLADIVTATADNRRLMVTLAAWCTLRFGELTELRRKDIDVKNRVIHVRRAVVHVNGKAIVKTPKTEAGERDVAIPPHIVDDVAAHLLAYTAPGKDGLLFPAAHGGHLSPGAWTGKPTRLHTSGPKKGQVKNRAYGWCKAREAADLPELHLHDLRHTGLTWAATTGATIAELMAMAGHSTPAAAMIYQHAAQDRMQDLAAKLSQIADTASTAR